MGTAVGKNATEKQQPKRYMQPIGIININFEK
jgi:hypothetical protein